MPFRTSHLTAPLRRRVLYLAALAALLIASGIGILALVLARKSSEAFSLEAKSRDILTTAERVVSALTTAETAQRGYLLTHRQSYLDPYQTNVTAANENFAELRSAK